MTAKFDFPGLKTNQNLASLTTFNIGGPADFFYEAKKEKDLINLLVMVKEKKIPFFVLGAGSNILFSDKGFAGLIIKIALDDCRVENDRIKAGAGVSLSKLVNLAVKEELSGLEFAAGIPGTIGGALFGNAGAWQQSIGDKVERVKILDEDGQFKWLNHEECQFAYRQSRFKKTKEIILMVELKLTKGKIQEIQQKVQQNLTKRLSQPKEPSAGSVFINPKPDSAGVLIEKCGLKGQRIGGAKISEQHANFIVNTGGAKASDVLKLIALVRKKVKQQFEIDLKTEISFLE